MAHRPSTPATVVPYPGLQRQIADWLALAARSHSMHALVEVDVTDARRSIREARARTGEPLSLTAFVVSCLARAIAEDRRFHALRLGRDRLVLFEDVDVAIIVERIVAHERIPFPLVVRAADRKNASTISREIQRASRGPVPYRGMQGMLPLWLRVPAGIRRAVWWRWLADPWRHRRLAGTTFVSAVGMFGHGRGWGIPQGQHYALAITVGGLDRRPGIVHTEDGEGIEPREYLALTLSMDHDLIEGAPAARFALRLQELLQAGPSVGAGAGAAAPVGTP